MGDTPRTPIFGIISVIGGNSISLEHYTDQANDNGLGLKLGIVGFNNTNVYSSIIFKKL
jgi:hypothetical protein